MDEVRQIIEALKEYRAELVHKNYPIKINELIIKWEDWLNTPKKKDLNNVCLMKNKHLKSIQIKQEKNTKIPRADKISKNIPFEIGKEKTLHELLMEGFNEEQKGITGRRIKRTTTSQNT